MKWLMRFFPLCFLGACGTSFTASDRELFRKADANGDGRLSFEEANQFELSRVFQDVDTNHDGKVTFAEARDIHPDFRWKQFSEYDQNGNDVVSYKEFYVVQTRRGGVRARFTAADVDADGYVTEKEAKKRVKWLMDEAEGGW